MGKKNEYDAECLRLYPPPRNGEKFVEKWKSFIPMLHGREGFQRGHLFQLEVLCDLYQEYHELNARIELEGFLVEIYSKTGIPINQINPLISIRGRIASEIRQYTRELGLNSKYIPKVHVPGDTEDEWEV